MSLSAKLLTFLAAGCLAVAIFVFFLRLMVFEFWDRNVRIVFWVLLLLAGFANASKKWVVESGR